MQKTLSRRQIITLFGRSAVCGSALLLSPGLSRAAGARDGSPRSGASETDLDTLVSVVRLLFPHDRLSDDLYRQAADAVYAGAAGTAASLDQLRSGLAGIAHLAGDGGWATLNEPRRLEILEVMEQEPFWDFLRTGAIEFIYREPETWKLLGYGGNALAQGGYLARGFNDIAWLPEGKR